MVARIKTIAFNGMQAIDVDVQVRISAGLPSFQIVGLADKAVGESKDRIRNAIESLGISLPARRITVNLSPADLQKEGSHYDLPIALAILMEMEVLPPESLANTYALGELSLDGKLASVAGILVAALHAFEHDALLLCPLQQSCEAMWAGEKLRFQAAETLGEFIRLLKGHATFSPPPLEAKEEQQVFHADLLDVKGQETAKRALEIAAAGGLNLLFIGPAGSGKSMLASRLTELLPPLLPEESIETTMIYSLAGEKVENGLIRKRPYRAPHHSASMAALTGGGPKAMPGEISLAHHGVLFLDELPEFQGRVLDSLRQPLETGEITVSRASAHITWPAKFQLIAAMNPCRCSHLYDPSRACPRAPACGEDYQRRISGPLMDRFDIIIQVPAVSASDLLLPAPKEGSFEVKERVLAARRIQWRRYKGEGFYTNRDAKASLLEKIAMPYEQNPEKLKHIIKEKQLSARGFHRLLKVARTIADLEASENVKDYHLSEAIQLRKHL